VTRYACFGLFGVLLAGCSFENYGLDYTSVELSASLDSGAPASRLSRPLCVTLPVLIGSIVEERQPIEDSLSVVLRAMPDRVELRFSGAVNQDANPLVVRIDDLEGGYATELELETRSGTAVTVSLNAPCSSER
jgi:hypothetical protein